jgi:hypothetical protein
MGSWIVIFFVLFFSPLILTFVGASFAEVYYLPNRFCQITEF